MAGAGPTGAVGRDDDIPSASTGRVDDLAKVGGGWGHLPEAGIKPHDSLHETY
jgi:hypothetical protein